MLWADTIPHHVHRDAAALANAYETSSRQDGLRDHAHRLGADSRAACRLRRLRLYGIVARGLATSEVSDDASFDTASSERELVDNLVASVGAHVLRSG
jgi:hypothetical protein